MHILFIKTSSLGDVIHNLPVVNDLLKHYPEATIDWVVEESFADIPKLHPHVHQVHTVAIRRWRKQLFTHRTWREIRTFFSTLRRTPYDVVIDTQGLIKSGLIARMARGARHGYDQDSIREPLASRCYQHTHAISYQQHAVTRNRALVALSLGYPVPAQAPDYGLTAPILNTLATSKNPDTLDTMTETWAQTPYVMALHGTSRDSKLWPESEWIALGKALEKTASKLVLPWASQAEFTRANRIAAQLTQAVVLPKCSIQQLAGIIGRAQAAVGVDTGLSHLAAALNIPTVAIYTDTNPALTGVMQGAVTRAVNLGGIAQTPSHTEVLSTLQSITSTRIS